MSSSSFGDLPSSPPGSPGLPKTYSTVNFDLAIDGVERRLGKYNDLLDNPPLKTPPELFEEDVIDRPIVPNGPGDFDKQIWQLHEFKVGGLAGLASSTMWWVKHASGQHASSTWRHLTEDSAKIPFTDMLCTMYAPFIEALLRGDLMYQYFNDGNFRSAVNIYHGLKKYPGHYIQCVCLKEEILDGPIPPDTQMTQKDRRRANQDAGKWLTPRQISEYIDGADRYANPKLQADHDFAKRVDEHWQPPHDQPLSWYQNKNRRYIQNGIMRKKFNEWVRFLKKLYADRIDLMLDRESRNEEVEELDEAMRCILFEIGYGVDVLPRATAHNSHSSSNDLFAFHQALITELFDQSKDKFVVERFMTNPIPKADFKLVNIADIGITMLGQGVWLYGGLNIVPGAGGGVSESGMNRNTKFFEENYRKIYVPHQLYQTNLKKDEVKMKDLEKMQAAFEAVPQMAIDLRDKRKHLEVVRDRIGEKLDRLKELRRVREVKDMAEGRTFRNTALPSSTAPRRTSEDIQPSSTPSPTFRNIPPPPSTRSAESQLFPKSPLSPLVDDSEEDRDSG